MHFLTDGCAYYDQMTKWQPAKENEIATCDNPTQDAQRRLYCFIIKIPALCSRAGVYCPESPPFQRVEIAMPSCDFIFVFWQLAERTDECNDNILEQPSQGCRVKDSPR